MFVAVGVAGAILAAIATAAPSQRVTLAVQRYFDPACTPLPGRAPSQNRGGCEKLRFSGAISSNAANEYVSVLYQGCGGRATGTSLVGAQTQAGGSWEAEWSPAPGMYRARWRASTSAPVRFRDSVPLTLTKLNAFRHRVSVQGLHGQDMKGRIVELQRLVAGEWRRLRRARFVADRSQWGVNASATFAVRRRGLALRAFVPGKSAAPCYVATASETWTSGVATGPGPTSGTRIVDRTFLCSTEMQGGIRMISIHASSGSGEGTAQRGPSISLLTGHAGSLASASTSSLYLYPDRCTDARAPVPLAARSLVPRPPGLWREFECEAPQRVLLRVRAAFRAPTTLESSRSSYGYRLLSAQGEISEAAIAIRTQAGKPLAYASLSASGRARLHAARNCAEDT